MTPNLALQYIALVATVCLAQQQQIAPNKNQFESTDWIPMRQPCPTCHGDQEIEDQLPQKSGRVLNTAVAFQRNNLPQQKASNFPIGVGKQHLNHHLPPGLTFANGPPPTFLNQAGIPNLFQIPIQNGPPQIIQSGTENLTPQFLPHLEQANFNGHLQVPIHFAPTAQGFLPPQPHQQRPLQAAPQQPQFVQSQYFSPPNYNQPQDDFNLLQQILNNQNPQFVQSLFNVNQTQELNALKEIPKVTSTSVKPTEPIKLSSTTPLPQKSQTKEEVQLLYVPLETLRQRGTTKAKTDSVTEKSYQGFVPTVNTYPDFKTQLQNEFTQQSLQAEKLENQFQQNTIQESASSALPTNTTPLPKKKNKLKPHQPPLSVFMGAPTTEDDVKINDVLSALGSARTITVLDQVTNKMPQVFVGPSNMKAPDGYAKFDLPYLSNLDNNRIQRKVEQLPFFVAPLSYRAPDGYSKIPFPPPHIGSVVIRDMKDVFDKPEDPISSLYSGTFKDKLKTTSNFPQNQFNSNFGSQANSNKYFESSSSTPSTPRETFNNLYPSSLFPQSPVSQGALDNYYFTKGTTQITSSPLPNRGYSQTYQTTPKSIYSTLGVSSTPAAITDYTVLEQFPVKEDVSTQSILSKFKQTQQTSTDSYFPVNLEKYRTHPLGINDEIGNTQTKYQNGRVVPVKNQGLSTSAPLRGGHTYRISSTTAIPQTNNSPKPTINYYPVSSSTEQPIKTDKEPKYLLPTIPSEHNQFPQNYFAQPSPVLPLLPNDQYSNIYNQQFAQIPQTHFSNFAPQNNNDEPVLIGNQQIKPTTESSIRQTVQTNSPSNLDNTATSDTDKNQDKLQYSLPAELPPINPNLPGLINSLQIGQQAQNTVADSSSESTSQHSTSTHEPTSTRRPISRGRQRPYNRGVSSQSTTTVSPSTVRSRSTAANQRRRRPYNGKPRQEYEKYLEKPNYPSTTALTPTEAVTTTSVDVEIPTTRATRGRYNYQQEQSTEAPKRSNANTSQTRTRFRTRGRQQQRQTTTTTTTTVPTPTVPSSTNGHQNDVTLTERSSIVYASNDNQQIYQQPKLEGGFQASQQQQQEQDFQQYIQEQRPVYRPEESQENYNSQPNLNQVHQQNYQNEQVAQYTPQLSQPESTNPTVKSTPLYSDVSASSRDISFQTTPKINYGSTLYPQNPPEPEIISQSLGDQSDYVRFNGGTQQTSVLQHSTEAISTRRTNNNSRTRGKQRHRGRQQTTTTTEPVETTTILTHKNDQSEPEEFFGFFRMPIYQQQQSIINNYQPKKNPSSTPQYNDYTATERPQYFSQTERPQYVPQTERPQYVPQTERPQYIQQTERPQYFPQTDRSQYFTQTERPQHVSKTDHQQYFSQTDHPQYFPQSERSQHVSQTDHPYFSQTERASTESSDTVYVDSFGNTSPASVYPTYVENTSEHTTKEPQLTQEELRPVYRQPTEEPTTKSHNHYSINKSTVNRFVRPTTIPYTTSIRTSVNENVYTVRPVKRPDESTNKITRVRGRIRKPFTTTTEEVVEYYPDGVVSPSNAHEQTTKYLSQSQKIKHKIQQNRGNTHFVGPHSEKADDELEEPNYPASFLHPEETQTKRPEFKITVPPLDGEYSDQIPYHSINRPKFVYKNPENGGSESQWSSKYTSTYFRKHHNNTNEIPSESKEEQKSEIKNITLVESASSEESTIVPETSNENEKTEQTTESKSIFEQIFEEMAKFGMDDATTTETTSTTEHKLEETVGEIKLSKGKRRGFWKRVRVRPLDGLETAESQNIGTASLNHLISDSVKRFHPRPTIEQYLITFEPNNETRTESIPTEYKSVLDRTQKSITSAAKLNETENIEEENKANVTQNPEIPEETNINATQIITETKSEPIPETTENIIESTTESEQIDFITTTQNPVSTIKEKNVDLSTETQINETKIISEKIKMYTERLEEKNKSDESKSAEKIDVSDPFILGTSTSTEISHETEICYRGRCIKSNSTDTSITPVS